ncbi:hypothetical protein BH10PLA1_BH10PLA1_11460 [soil metagenome]
MTHCDIIVETLERGLGMMQRELADFSDADMLVRPAPVANHAEWMLGHLCKSECHMLGACGVDVTDALPAGFAECYPQVKGQLNEVANPMGKAALLELFGKVRQRTIAFVKSAGDVALLKEIPSPFNKGTMTTVGFIVTMPSLHASMHIGQMQVIRRALGKPVLF